MGVGSHGLTEHWHWRAQLTSSAYDPLVCTGHKNGEGEASLESIARCYPMGNRHLALEMMHILPPLFKLCLMYRWLPPPNVWDAGIGKGYLGLWGLLGNMVLQWLSWLRSCSFHQKRLGFETRVLYDRVIFRL